MPKLVKFEKPYYPNDGHGPGVPLPRGVYGYLMGLDGVTGTVEGVIQGIQRLWPDCEIEDHGDFIGIAHANHRWWGIGYREIEHGAE